MRNQKVRALEAAQKNIASPHIRSTIDRLASISPAAKRLASSTIGVKDYTPSPRSTPLSRQKLHTPSPRKTPLVRITPNHRPLSSTTPSVTTDDLLNIQKKSKRES